MTDLIGDGDCYVVAGRAALENPFASFLVCHGTAVGRGDIEGIEFGHAWIESGDIVLDKSNGLDIRMMRDAYYALGQIKDVSRYEVKKAREHMREAGHFGPWKDAT